MYNKFELKFFLTFIIILLIFSNYLVTIEICNAEPGFRFFTFETDTELLLEEDSIPTKPIFPGNSKEIDLTIKFRYILPRFFLPILTGTKIGNWIMFRDINSNMQVSLDLEVKSPDFCDLELRDYRAIINNISTEFKEFKTGFILSMNENAEAFKNGKINITAKFRPENNWALEPSQDSYEFNITVDYYNNFTINSTKYKIIPPLIETVIPIYINNSGNTNLIVNSSVKNLDGWNVNIIKPIFTVNISETVMIYVNITPPKKFNNEEIVFKFQAYPKNMNPINNNSIKFWNIILENDGSYKDEETFPFVYLFIIIIIILIGSIILFKKFI